MREEFMRRALELARQSLHTSGALPYAAVIAKDEKIIGEGLNMALAKHDPTSHGEVEAIRDACSRIGSTQLAGCDLYTTAEPCSMCVATMFITGIENLYYAGSSRGSAAFIGRLARANAKFKRRLSNDDLRDQVGRRLSERKMPATQLLADEAEQLFDEFAKRMGV